MAVYKVPQDVEAEDKLLGPFSFKQFIFLIVTVMALGMAYALSQVLLPLAIIPLPIAIFFGTLALPLRKDQPMEVYLAAVISFILKPKSRLWRPDGIESLIQVTAPKVEDKPFGKGYSQEEVQRRLSYLAGIVDSRGWSVRGVEAAETPMRADLYNEAQAVDDLLDDGSSRAQQINDLLVRNDNERRQQIVNRMKQTPQPTEPTVPNIQAPEPVQAANQQPPATQPSEEDIKLVVNPYPTMSQSMISPLAEQPAAQPTPAQPPTPTQVQTPEPAPAPKTPSEEQVSPAIIDLANNHDYLSVATLQREAERIKKKQESEEVVISLR